MIASKSEAMRYIQSNFGIHLSNANCSFSNINVAKKVWWTNVPLPKFNDAYHLLFNDTNELIWIELPKHFVKDLTANFKIRPDRNSVDFEVWAEKDERYMKDVKSGGSGFNFKPYIKEVILK